MFRWFIVCALLVQTLAMSRPSRHGWPNWMEMPRVSLPDWMEIPTRDDLPEVTIPDISLPELPTLPQVGIPDVPIPEIDMQIPDIDMQMPDAFHRLWNPSQSSRNNGGQRVQSNNGKGRKQGNRDIRPDHVSSSGQMHWSWQDSNNQQGSNGRGRPDNGRRPTQQGPQRGSPNGRGQRPVPAQTGRGRPDHDRQANQQRPQQGSVNGRGQHQMPSQTEQQRPSQTNPRRPGKERKQRPQPREGPPQRQEPIRKYPKTRRPSTQGRVATRPRSEPSVAQQVEQFQSGMPTWLQDELSDTFTSMKHEIDQGRLRMDSWMDDIRTSAQNWWDRWSGSTNTNSRPTVDTGRETPRPQQPTSHRDYGRHGGRFGDRGRHNGHSRDPSKGRKHHGSRTWFNITACRRPFRPRFEGPSREEPDYKVLCGGNDYEARLYNTSVWVSVTVQALTYDLAVHKAYMKLYRYINGHNSRGAEVTRTVPVHTKVKSNARENRWFERHNYTISFYLPEDVHIDPPAPNDPALFIEREVPTVYYAHTFRGYALEFNIWEYLDELTGTLEISQEAYKTEDYIVNVYEAPWRFFNRRNEILVAMDTNLLQMPSCTDPASEPLVTSKPETTSGPTPTVATTGAPPTKGMPIETTFEATTEGATTKKATTTAQPTIIGEIPAEIILPAPKNPFENNNLEQETGMDCEQGSECPRSETAIAYEGFELRHYAYSRWICIDQAACDLERAQKLTHGPLLEYFYPQGNREQTTMKATTPLVIGMDVSDLNSTDCGKIYTSCMFIPEEHQGDPPTPRDARLYFQDIPAMSRYVMPFAGFATSQNVPKFGVEFLMELENTKLPYDGSIVAVAQYTTSKSAKTRLNELWVMDQSLLIQGNLELQ